MYMEEERARPPRALGRLQLLARQTETSTPKLSTQTAGVGVSTMAL
jgi:hypothetical protein